jgi:hypothetical protein
MDPVMGRFLNRNYSGYSCRRMPISRTCCAISHLALLGGTEGAVLVCSEPAWDQRSAAQKGFGNSRVLTGKAQLLFDH